VGASGRLDAAPTPIRVNRPNPLRTRAAGRAAYSFTRTNNMVEERGEGMGGGHVAADELRLLIERAERLEEEKKGIQDDIKDVMSEAKSRGYDPKAIRKIMSIRKKKREEYQEEEAILEVYMQALGMI
jgi:uncharacterized protein (UPF0335 family)